MVINFSTISSKKSIFKIGLFFLLTLVIRLPFFFRDVITPDESTYILIGQSFLDGYDPGRDYWMFRGYPYSLFLLIFGKSIVGIRLAGTLCVAIISFFLYLIGKYIVNDRTGIIAGVLFIFMSGLWPTGQSTRAEIIALVPLIAAFLLLIKNKNTPRILFFTGILITISNIIRLNLAYVTLIIGIYIVLGTSPKSWLNLFRNAVAYSLGSFLVFFLSWLPFVFAGVPKLWWRINIVWALKYSETGLPMFTAFKQHIDTILKTFSNQFISGVSIIVWLGGLFGFLILLCQWQNASKNKKRAFILLILFFSGTALSILRGGIAYPHYLTQLFPFICLTSAVFIDVLFSWQNKWIKWIATIIISLTLLLSLKPILGNYKWRIATFLKSGEINYGESYKIAAYLKQYGNLDNDLYIMSQYHHIVYLLIDAMPMTTYTVHPGAITKNRVLEPLTGSKNTTETALTKILSQKPKFIITGQNDLKDKVKAELLLKNILKNEYELIKEIETAKIYRRI